MGPIKILSALSLLLGELGAAYAMSCSPPPPIGTAISDAKHVFVAQVRTAALSADKRWVEATFDVEEVLKGDPNQVPQIRWEFNDYNYGAADGALISGSDSPLFPGMHLLVFTSGDGPALYGPCTRTKRLSRFNDPGLQAARSLVNSK